MTSALLQGQKNHMNVKVKPAGKLVGQQSQKQRTIQTSYFPYSRKLAHAKFVQHI